jgi:serpin B
MALSPRSLLILPLLLAACPSPGGGDDDGGSPDFEEARSNEPHDEDPQVTTDEAEALADANRALALDLYHELREGQSVNRGFSVSPYSIQTAFGMLYGGTVEPARTEMATALHFPLEGQRQHVGHNWVDAQLAARNMPAINGDPLLGDQDPVIVDTANGVWIREDLESRISPTYLDLLAIHYDAGVYLARFRSQPDVEREGINRWVAQRTRDLIPDLLPAGVITTDTVVVLVNALYLKAPWQVPFDSNQTTNEPFTRLDGATITVPMMRAPELEAAYAEGQGWQAVAVPMRGDSLELVILLPTDFAAFEASIDAVALEGVFDALTPMIVDTAMPRFNLDTKLELTPELRALGMSAPFDDDDSFNGILTGLGVITTVVHQTVIKVDEKGTEASAATGIVIDETSALEPEATIMIDRPFMLAIRDQPTDTVLFLGRVLEPNAN